MSDKLLEKLTLHAATIRGSGWDVRDAGGVRVALLPDDREFSKEFASELVRRWNAHAGMVEALREMVIASHGLPAKPSEESDPAMRSALERAAAILAGEP